jgi:hypothetical protein
MQTDNNKAECINVSAHDGIGVSMDAARTKRFYGALSQLARAIHSLEVAAQNMKGGFEVSADHLDPCATLRAFSTTMDQDINLLFQMMVGEEDAEAGHD